jgi:hypothetical protein
MNLALDRSGLHLLVEVDPAHHHEDDVNHDVVLERFVEPDGVSLLRREASAPERCQHVARVIGTDEEVDVVRPARPAHKGRGESSQDQERQSRLFDGLDGFAQDLREALVRPSLFDLEDVTLCDS